MRETVYPDGLLTAGRGGGSSGLPGVAGSTATIPFFDPTVLPASSGGSAGRTPERSGPG